MFHPGFLFTRPVVVNVVRDGVATPVPYSAGLFDYGRVKFDKPLPVNLGFAGFRLHYPLNDPRIFDELISFIGASYFRVLGRDQRYGLSARGLSIGAGVPGGEEFPMFREFWVESPAADAERRHGLRAARFRLGDRRLPLPHLSGRRQRARRLASPCSRASRSSGSGWRR